MYDMAGRLNINNGEPVNDTTTRDYLRVLFRQKFMIVATVVMVCATVFVGLQLKTKVYESRVRMLITAEKQVEATYYKEMYGGRNVQQTLTQSEIVKSSPVINRVVRALALDKRPLDDEKAFSSPLKAMLIDYRLRAFKQNMAGLSEEQRQDFLFRRAVQSLKANITVEPVRDTNMFTISVKDYDPVGAAVIANVVSRSYVMFDLEQQLAELKLKYGEKHPTVNLIEDSVASLGKTLSGQPIGDVEAIGPASVKIMEQASVAMGPTGTPQTFILGLAFILGVCLAVILAFIFEYTDQTLRSPEDIRRDLNLPYLGSIPRRGLFDRALITNGVKRSFYARAYQTLSDQVYMLTKNKGIKSLLVTSFGPQNEAATVTANLGLYLADRLHHKVLIMDVDFRSPAIGKIFNISENLGLASVLQGEGLFDNIVHKKGSNLSILPAGKTVLNPLTLLDSSEMAEVLREVKEKYEIILINCGSKVAMNYASTLTPYVEGAALIVNEGVSRRHVIQNALGSLGGKQVNILGVILNNRTFPIPQFVYDNV